MKYLELLSNDEIEQIHESTLDLLETKGIKVEDAECRQFLGANGGIVNDETKYVQLPKDLVQTQLKKVPSSFSLYGSSPDFHNEITTDSVHFATIGNPVKIYDPNLAELSRPSTLADTIAQLRIVDMCDNLLGSHIDVWPNDVPQLELHYHAIRAWAENSHKSYGLGCFGKTPSYDMMELMAIAVGGVDNLKRYPCSVGFFNTTSPLLLPKLMTNGLEVMAQYDQPFIIAPCAVGGATAPITIAGLLTQCNMEILAGITLAELYRPELPILYGSVSSPMDLSTGNVAWGAVETGMIQSGIAQLARFYNIPSRGPGCITDSKCLDIQNGYERFMTLFFAATSGTNYITCAGTFESSLSEALELLVIDDDIISSVLRAMDGIKVDEETIAKDVIGNVAQKTTKNNYLHERHTLNNMRKEIYTPKFADRQRAVRWRKEGSPDIIARAHHRVEEILATQQGPGISPEVAQQFDQYLELLKTRTYEDYKRLEGVTSEVPATPDFIPKDL